MMQSEGNKFKLLILFPVLSFSLEKCALQALFQSPELLAERALYRAITENQKASYGFV